jgi:hypothetical protein
MKTMPAGASPKREREYRALKHRFKDEGRYRGREAEVASRIVNKQRTEYGETNEERRKDRAGTSPDRGLPIDDYQHLTVPEVVSRLEELSSSQLRRIQSYERKHKGRKTLLAQLDRQLH